jgi:hypothetical protein
MNAEVEDLALHQFRSELLAALRTYLGPLEDRIAVLEELARLDGHDLAEYAQHHS